MFIFIISCGFIFGIWNKHQQWHHMQKNNTRQKVTYEIVHKYFNFRFHMQNTQPKGWERKGEAGISWNFVELKE